jgi:hypothetical protein
MALIVPVLSAERLVPQEANLSREKTAAYERPTVAATTKYFICLLILIITS